MIKSFAKLVQFILIGSILLVTMALLEILKTGKK